MTVENQKPSYDPADAGTLAGVLKYALRKASMNTEDMLPAKVIAYDRTKNIAQVQPLIAVLTTDGKTQSRAQIAEVPVLALGGGGFVVNFPIKTGDLGWIKANDRDISLYLQGLSESKPNTLRLHSFADGLFIPDIVRGFTIAGEDAGAMVIQKLDSSVRIAIHDDKVKITAPAIIFDTPQATFTGDVQVDGTINADGDVVASGISGNSHVHGGVQTGSGDTGGPV